MGGEAVRAGHSTARSGCVETRAGQRVCSHVGIAAGMVAEDARKQEATNDKQPEECA